MTTTKTTHTATAQQAFISKKAEIDRMIGRMQSLSANNFNRNPEMVNWGDVGTLAHYEELLKRITDAAFKEGEFAS